jgi:hypothetical protein
MHQKNYRGKVLTQLINLKEQYKETDKVVSGYVGGIIEDILLGWKKEDLVSVTVVREKKS